MCVSAVFVMPNNGVVEHKIGGKLQIIYIYTYMKNNIYTRGQVIVTESQNVSNKNFV